MWKSKPNLGLPIIRRGSWDGDRAINNVFKYTSDGEDTDALRGFFFLYDDEKEGLKAGYKLPFVDIVDDKPVIIYDGLVAVSVFVSRVTDVPEPLLIEIAEVVEELKDKFLEAEEDKGYVKLLSMLGGIYNAHSH